MRVHTSPFQRLEDAVIRDYFWQQVKKQYDLNINTVNYDGVIYPPLKEGIMLKRT